MLFLKQLFIIIVEILSLCDISNYTESLLYKIKNIYVIKIMTILHNVSIIFPKKLNEVSSMSKVEK